MSEELTVVAVDAMGGDNAPGELVKGAVNAVKDEDNIKVILVGKEDAIKKELGKYEYDENGLWTNSYSIKDNGERVLISKREINYYWQYDEY